MKHTVSNYGKCCDAINCFHLQYSLFRGQDFRKVFHEIGNLRGLLPKSVKVMALTATATKQTFECAVERLSMCNPVVIGLPPNRQNIKYVLKPAIKKREFAQGLAQELLLLRTLTPKTDMFTAGSTSVMRQQILEQFSKPQTKLRVILATCAFGLGVDSPDITRVINWGPPPTLEDLLQQSGRAGRDGTQSEAILYYVKPGKNTADIVKEYGTNNKICRRKLLYRDFLFSASNTYTQSCTCCDLCEVSCACILCKQ